MRCPECGSELSENVSMCPSCGAPISSGPASRGGERGFFSRHLERILLIGGIAFIALGAWTVYAHKWDPPINSAGSALDHANSFARLLFFALVSVIVVNIVSAQSGRIPFIRRIPGLNAVDEAVGRATELGRPILFSSGLSGLSIVGLQALAVASHVWRSAVRYGTRMIMPVCDPTMMPITEAVMREGSTAEGHPEAYREEDIRFLSDRQFAYAAGVTGILHREKVAASFLFGSFAAEALILAENGQAVGAIQVAGTPDMLQIPFFVVTCDYTIIGDEYYAATAYLSREPTQLGSLIGQDIGKVMMLLLIIVGMVWTVFAIHNPIFNWLGGQ